MGKKGKKRRKYGTNTHHIFCRSTHPQFRNEDWNKITVSAHDHALYHQLFNNKTPRQILDYLVTTFWGGKIDPPTQGVQWCSHQTNRKSAILRRSAARVFASGLLTETTSGSPGWMPNTLTAMCGHLLNWAFAQIAARKPPKQTGNGFGQVPSY